MYERHPRGAQVRFAQFRCYLPDVKSVLQKLKCSAFNEFQA
ncbi:hypothetical protein PPHE_a2020 [Pseudoalteromonas phenolica O-BC30]|nr:hypothetical protein [Pseudoalteromonas phenolica O-BC30]